MAGSYYSETVHPPSVPRRPELLAKLAFANKLGWLWVILNLGGCIAAGIYIDWQAVLREPLVSTVAIGMMVGPSIMPILYLWAQNKKEIGDLKETTRFGVYDKHHLRTLFQETMQKLGMPDDLRVYITADKSMNAMSVNLGWLSFFRSVNGIYLHRQVLHRLAPEEIQDLMGHEVGHYYKYYLVNQRFLSLSVVFGALQGLLVAQWFGMTSYFSVMVSFVVASFFGFVGNALWNRYGETIEYLCDDLGAHVGGVATSINGLLKVGLDAECQLAIQKHALLAQKQGDLSVQSVMQAVEQATPLGRSTPEELKKAVDRVIKTQQAKNNQSSIAGFFDYAWNSDSEDDVEDQVDAILAVQRALESMPRLDWESLSSSPNEVMFYDYEVEQLVEMIESNPDDLLFRLPTEAGLEFDVHPPLRDRILYLWYNRREIENSTAVAYDF